ncbi:MAG TPA: hypothetical protein VH142_24225 [Polyangiaceae bacterium]|nr:hypothetical protein [Polyangiaceae bacterium]
MELVPLGTERVALEASIEATGKIGRRAGADALRALGNLVAIARRSGDGQIVAFATPTLGGADNVDDYLHSVRKRYGFATPLLAPSELLRLTYLAAQNELDVGDAPVTIAHLGDSTLELGHGAFGRTPHAETLALGVARLHRAFGACETGFPTDDVGALFSLVRLSCGPASRALDEFGRAPLVVASEHVTAVCDVARTWGYVDDDSTSLGRLALHALVPEILAASPATLCRLGVDPLRAPLVGTAAVILDALADLLGQREIRFTRSGAREGLALEALAMREHAEVADGAIGAANANVSRARWSRR